VVPITHTNAKGKTSYLHEGTTKTGKPKYYCSMESEGHLAEDIPVEFESYENPNAQVFLRRIPPKIIPDEERKVVEDGMHRYSEIVDEAIRQMELHLEHPTEEAADLVQAWLSDVRAIQNTYRNQAWGPVRIIHSTEVLLIEYALSCLLQPAASADWGYYLARQYAERYDPQYGTGLIPESAPWSKTSRISGVSITWGSLGVSGLVPQRRREEVRYDTWQDDSTPHCP
jgi:hypothetical protein